MLRHVGDLTTAEIAERIAPAAPRICRRAHLRPRRRRPRRAGADRRRGPLDRRRRRRPLPRRARRRPPELPPRSGFSNPCRTRSSGSSNASPPPTRRSHTTAELHGRYLVDPAAVLAGLEARGALVRGELRPGGTAASGATPRCCAASAAPHSPRCARRSNRATSARSRASCPAGTASTATPRPVPAPTALRDILVPLQGLALPAAAWESAVLPRRLGAYSQSWLDQLCASGEIVWIGAGALGRDSGRVALYFRDDAPLLGRPIVPGQPRAQEPPEGKLHDALRERLRAGACFFTDLLVAVPAPATELHERSGISSGPAKSRTTRSSPSAPAALPTANASNAPPPPPPPPRGAASPSAAAPHPRSPSDAGRSPNRCCSPNPAAATTTAPAPNSSSNATASSPANSSSPRRPPASAPLYPPSATSRRSASHAAATSSRDSAAHSSLCPAPSIACAPTRIAPLERRPPVVLDAVDPAQPYGAVLPWPKRERPSQQREHCGARATARGRRRHRARRRRTHRLPRALPQGPAGARPADRRTPRSRHPRPRRLRPLRPQAPPDRTHRRRTRRRPPAHRVLQTPGSFPARSFTIGRGSGGLGVRRAVGYSSGVAVRLRPLPDQPRGR